MNKNKYTTIFLLCVLSLFSIVVIHNFNKYIQNKDYILTTYTSCNPDIDSCFKVNPDNIDFAFYLTPYKKVDIEAQYAPTCLDEHTCQDFTCDGINGFCEITYCDLNVIEEGEFCTTTN